MTISHEGFTFGNHFHTPLVQTDPPQPQIKIEQIFGLQGEGHSLSGKVWGMGITCRLTMTEYPTRGLLQAGLDEINARIGRLTGNLIESTDSGTVIFRDVTFLGPQPLGAPFLDGSGVHGWTQFVQLFWRSRKPIQ